MLNFLEIHVVSFVLLKQCLLKIAKGVWRLKDEGNMSDVFSGSSGFGCQVFPGLIMVQVGMPDPGILEPSSTALICF